jgi:formate dehydrogenase assembly factor FdhD
MKIILNGIKFGIEVKTANIGFSGSWSARAEVANLTLAGFVRGKRMNIYNAPEYLATCKF